MTKPIVQRPHPVARLWRDTRIRSFLIQGFLILGLLATGGWIIHNTLMNLESRGISTGFDFLSQQAGFGIIQSLVDYNESHSFGKTFVVGVLNTLLVSVLGIVVATILGFLIGIARLSSNWLLARLAGAYIEIFRNIPLLLQIFFWYFAVLAALPHPRQSLALGDAIFMSVRGIYIPGPVMEGSTSWLLISYVAVIGICFSLWYLNRKILNPKGRNIAGLAGWFGLLLVLPLLLGSFIDGGISWENPVLKGFNFTGGIAIIPELCALLMALSIYTAAFIAEIVRAGIESVSKGQKEAATALGLKPGVVLRLVIIPQAMRVVIPPLTSQYLNLVKNSSLATAIGYPDLVNVFAGTTLNQTGQAVEVISMTMAVYLLISLLVSLFMNIYNKKMSLVER